MDCSLRFAELVILHVLVDLLGHPIQATDDPAVFSMLKIGDVFPTFKRIRFLQVGHHVSGSVPQFVGEVSASLQLALVHPHVVAWGCAGGQCESDRIRAIQVDNLQRIEDIALNFAHLDTVRVQHHSMEIHRVERLFAHVEKAAEDHPRHPEKQDVVARLHDRGWVEII